AGAPRGDDGDVHGLRHRPRQFQVEPGPGAVGVDAGEEDLPGTQLRGLAGPFHRVQGSRLPAPVGVHGPAGWPGVAGTMTCTIAGTAVPGIAGTIAGVAAPGVAGARLIVVVGLGAVPRDAVRAC